MRKVKALLWAKTAPEGISLARGELPELSEYPIRIQYSDGGEELRVLGYFDNFGLKPYRKGEQTATFRLGDCAISFQVFYEEQKLTRVETFLLGRTEYLEGEAIGGDGFQAKAFYSDGSEKTVCLQSRSIASVDMNSVQIKNMNEATARVEIVKADSNCLYLYTIAFDRGKKTYQILDSIVAAYDTKEKTGGSSQPLKAQSYAKGSAMETVAEYIYSPQL